MSGLVYLRVYLIGFRRSVTYGLIHFYHGFNFVWLSRPLSVFHSVLSVTNGLVCF